MEGLGGIDREGYRGAEGMSYLQAAFLRYMSDFYIISSSVRIYNFGFPLYVLQVELKQRKRKDTMTWVMQGL